MLLSRVKTLITEQGISVVCQNVPFIGNDSITDVTSAELKSIRILDLLVFVPEAGHADLHT